MARHRFWLVFEPGLRGDMIPLHTWLDRQQADEVPGGSTFWFNGTLDAVTESLRGLNLSDNALRGYCVAGTLMIGGQGAGSGANDNMLHGRVMRVVQRTKPMRIPKTFIKEARRILVDTGIFVAY